MGAFAGMRVARGVGISMALAIAISIQGCVDAVYEVTSAPTAQPTPAPTQEPTITMEPTPSPTKAPTPLPFDINLVIQMLRTLMDTPEFLAKVNGALSGKIPNTVYPKVEAKAEERSVTASGTIFECHHYVRATAGLDQCTGLSTAKIAKMTDMQGTEFVTGTLGNLSVKVGAELEVGKASCTGSGKGEASSCGVAIWETAKVKAEVSLKKIDGELSAKLVDGIGPDKGKLCLKLTDLTGSVNQQNVEWSQLKFDMGSGVKVDVDQGMLNDLWDALPVDDVVQMIRKEVVKAVRDELVKITEGLCF